jgi:hypothetical protein
VNDTGLPGVTLADREHVCVFHRGPEERDTVLAALISSGLAEGDRCLCIADSPDTEAVAQRFDPERATRPDQLTVLPSTAYLTDGRFVPEQVYSQWHSIIGRYADEGYRHVRGTGELSWFLRRHRAGDPDGAAPLLVEYEALCNRLVKRRPATIFCVYDLDLLDAGLLPGVLRHHPAAIVRGTLFRAPWRVEERPGGADAALLLANLLLDGARDQGEITALLAGLREAVLDRGADPGTEGERFLQALSGLAAPHVRAVQLEAELATRPAAGHPDVPAAELARSLLDGTPLDPADDARLRSLGLDLDAPFRAVVVRSGRGPDAAFPAGTAAATVGAIRDELAASGLRLVAARPDEVAFLSVDGATLDSVLAGLSRSGRTVGIGQAHSGVTGAARSYLEARRAADFAIRLDRPVLRHEDLGLFSLLADRGDTGPMADLVSEWLGPLLAHDEARPKQALLPTLAAYLDTGAAQQATADALGIHVSTLKYRLGRIGAVAGRDLSRPDVRFQLQVALTAQRTLTVLRTRGG